ncbi:IS66 family transposase [Lacticaseibacillus rhamnosus]|uniref:IS66 family transposase n=1 Tax=Lacticaseibacillus rhamnosus TaxID=47715 RepID=UPI000AC3B38F|nr:IS66 family transposase [Lacticaseibacillus rhamnosus]MDK7183715.1 IS66 family transposase [Lacticaseibacillus rhamnosus]MDK7240513.1 IS66 family transposase [Lacticaseibacillus rhamnosus]MDT8863201.1 IS66 family transposase [Lacticaseibacillus rhamnosus]
MTTEEELKQLRQENEELCQTIKTLEQTNETLKQQNADLVDEVARLARWVYGKRSEQIRSEQKDLFEDVSVFFVPEQTGEQSESAAPAAKMEPKKKKKKATRKETLSPDMPTVEETIPCEQTTCPEGHELTNAGKHLVREELITIPRKTYRRKVYEAVKKCEPCSIEQDRGVFSQGHAPRPVIPHSLGSASAIASVAYQKFCLDVPLYRQMDEWAREGASLSEATLSNWIIQAAKYLQPVSDQIHSHLLQLRFLQGNETPYQVIRESGRKAAQKSYVWVMRSTHECRKPAIYYHYAQARSGDVAKEIYAGFDGTVQIDGYSGYNKLPPDITRTGCWAHVRRKFFDAFKSVLDQQTIPIPLGYIDRMFYLERQGKAMTAEQRYQFRQEKIAPFGTKFWRWIDGLTILPKGALGRAVQYAINQRQYLNRLLDYGEMDWSNNATERKLTPFS